MKTRISIAGDIGSGKSTVAKAMAERLGVEPLSTGGIQRQLAADRGINTLELNRLAETDPSIDQQIDDYLRALPPGPLVVESRMAWHFVADTTRIFLYILPTAAAERILGASRSDESYRHAEEAITRLRERRESEIHRFRKYYGVDIGNLRNYDLVIDTTHVGVDRIVDTIFAEQISGSEPRALVSPLDLLPTRALDAAEVGRLAASEDSLAARGFDPDTTIDALYVDHSFFIAHGHVQVAAAIRAGVDLVPCRIAACDDEAFEDAPSARGKVEAAGAGSLIESWRAAVASHRQF